MYITNTSLSRKLVIISLALLIYVSSLLGSYNRSAYAIGPLAGVLAAPAAAAVGPYIIAGLLIAGGAAVLVGANDPEIKRKSEEIYETMDDTFKQAVASSLINGYQSIPITTEMASQLDAKISATFSDWLIPQLKDFESKSVEGYESFQADGFGWKTISTTSPATKQIVSYGLANYITTGLLSGNTLTLDIKPSVTPEGTIQTGEQYTFSLVLTAAQITAWNAISTVEQYKIFLADVGYPVTYQLPNSEVITKTSADTNIGQAVSDLVGVNEINLPLDQWLAETKDIAGNPVNVDAATGVVTYPNGAVYEGDVTIPWTIPYTGAVPVPGATVGNPAIPIGNIFTPTIPPSGGGGSTGNPFTNLVPVAFLMAFLDLLRAVLMYLSRMFTFILTIPLIPAVPIDNVAFSWFREAKIIGVYIYNIVSSLATIGLSFAVYKSVRRLLP